MGQLTWRRKQIDLIYEGDYGQILKGLFHATTAGYGMKVNASRTWIERGNADDGGKVLATGQAYLFGSRRFLLTYAHTGNLSVYGGCDRCSVVADESAVTGFLGGHWGYLQLLSGGKVNVGGGVVGQIDVPTGADISNYASCFLANVNHLVAHTGKAVATHVTNPSASGLLDASMAFGTDGNDGTGCIDAGSTKSAPGTVDKWEKKYVAGTLYYTPLYASKTA
jgi:hypothetical protein